MADKNKEKIKADAKEAAAKSESNEGKESSREPDLLHEILLSFSRLDYIKPADIPDIPLYMDQITSLMDQKLKNCKRYPDDKILTKTMINNYTKNKLLPPPVKKKYSKEHLILLIFIYYLKDFLSIGDIKKILTPLANRHFEDNDHLSLTDLYERAEKYVKSQTDYMAHDLYHRYKVSKDIFKDIKDPEDRQYLDAFGLVTLLSFDVYVKKQIIEHLIDLMPDENEEKK